MSSKIDLEHIKSRGLEGCTKADIAREYKVSRQYVTQYIKKHIPEWDLFYGKIVKKKERERNYYLKWGYKRNDDLYKAQRQKFYRKKANAIRIGYLWDVKFGEIVWNLRCPIFGIELDYFAESTKENSPSFDRIDNSIGYTKNNVQIISWRANRIKNNGTSQEHRMIADYLDKINSHRVESQAIKMV